MPSKKSDLPDLEQRVVAFIARPGYPPVKPKVIAKKLGLSKDVAQRGRESISRRTRLPCGRAWFVAKSTPDPVAWCYNRPHALQEI